MIKRSLLPLTVQTGVFPNMQKAKWFWLHCREIGALPSYRVRVQGQYPCTADTMRTICASRCEGEELQLCRSGRRSDVKKVREHKSKITWSSLGTSEIHSSREAPVVMFSASLIWLSFQPTSTERPLKPAWSQDGTTLAGKWWEHTSLIKRAKNVSNCCVSARIHRTRLIRSGWCGSPPSKRTSSSLCPATCCLPRSAQCSHRRWLCWPVRLHEEGRNDLRGTRQAGAMLQRLGDI